MAESLFDIFGDHLTRKAVKNVSRHPISNIENMGKLVSSGPIKPNEPMKKIGETKKTVLSNNSGNQMSLGPIKPNESSKKVGEIKKSFLSNTGQAYQSTPMRKAFSPKTINVGQLIYTDDSNTNDKDFHIEELEFTKPCYKYNNYHKDLLDFLPMPEPQITKHISPPNTPPPATRQYSIEFDCSYQDEFFTDDFSYDSVPGEELGLPDLY